MSWFLLSGCCLALNIISSDYVCVAYPHKCYFWVGGRTCFGDQATPQPSILPAHFLVVLDLRFNFCTVIFKGVIFVKVGWNIPRGVIHERIRKSMLDTVFEGKIYLCDHLWCLGSPLVLWFDFCVSHSSNKIVFHFIVCVQIRSLCSTFVFYFGVAVLI